MKFDVRYKRRVEAVETRFISITGVHTGVLRRGDYYRHHPHHHHHDHRHHHHHCENDPDYKKIAETW
jgi:hypothetical protein